MNNDYRKDCFKTKKINDTIRFYIKDKNNNYILVNEHTYKLCKSNYNKIRYNQKKEVGNFLIYIDNIDYSTSFLFKKNHQDFVYNILLKDIYKIVINQINNLQYTDFLIAENIFLKEYSGRQTAKILDLPQTTVNYRKRKIQKILQKKILEYCSYEDLFK